MVHPKSKDVRKIVELFKTVLPLAKNDEQLRMACTYTREEPCGTVACHAGWFGIASKLDVAGRGWIIAANRMAENLGFKAWFQLNTWARSNPGIWGAPISGFHIFSRRGGRAFYHPTKRPAGAKNLQHIVDHWTEVAERLEAMERAEYPQITHPPVTAEQVIEELEGVTV